MMKQINYSILFCAISVALASSANATDIVNLAAKTHPHHNSHSSMMNPGVTSPATSTPSVQLDNGISFKQTNVVSLPNGNKQYRLQQYYKDVPIFGYSIVANKPNFQNQINESVYGDAITNFNQNNSFTKPDISKQQALKLVLNSLKGATTTNISNVKNKLYIYPQGNTPKLAYKVSFYFAGQTPQRPVAFIDAHSGNIIEHWNGLTNEQMFASGLGGNGNATVEYHANSNGVPITKQGDECYFDSEHVRTIDLNHKGIDSILGIFEPKNASDDPIMFNCQGDSPQYSKRFEGSYGLANDAQYYGEQIYKMYEQWFNTTPTNNDKLLMRIHFADHMDNAFFDGTYMNFGDGDGRKFYPFVTLDISAHEISHGFTEKDGNSQLIGGRKNNCEPCAINESFSDMAGEAAKYFTNGENDFHHAAMAMRNNPDSSKAIRYLDDPTRDGITIDNYQDYTSSTEVHDGAGIYDKAFYILAAQDGWGVKKAFSTFVLANEQYWNSQSDFEDAACGVLSAAQRLGNNTDDVSQAFADVGIYYIDLDNCYIN